MRRWLASLFRSFTTRHEADCSFCGASYRSGGPLIEAQDGALICFACVRRANTDEHATFVDSTTSETSEVDPNPYASPPDVACNFCGTSQPHPIQFTSSRVDVKICSDCVEICNRIIAGHEV